MLLLRLAAGTLIKSLHTKKGEDKARKQLRVLGITFSVAFLWDLFEWFFSGCVTLSAACACCMLGSITQHAVMFKPLCCQFFKHADRVASTPHPQAILQSSSSIPMLFFAYTRAKDAMIAVACLSCVHAMNLH